MLPSVSSTLRSVYEALGTSVLSSPPDVDYNVNPIVQPPFPNVNSAVAWFHLPPTGPIVLPLLTPSHSWPALIDEGASRVSLVSRATINSLNVPTTPISEVRLKPFSGSCVAANACAAVHFKLGKFRTLHSWQFLVVDELPYPFILGRDWKTAAHVLVDEPHAIYVRKCSSMPAVAAVIATASSADAQVEVPSVTHMATARCRLMQSKLDRQNVHLRHANDKIALLQEINGLHMQLKSVQSNTDVPSQTTSKDVSPPEKP